MGPSPTAGCFLDVRPYGTTAQEQDLNRRKLLARLVEGLLNNVQFGDFVSLVEGFGFELDRIRGSHHVYLHPQGQIRLVLQPRVDGTAKPYQARQLLRAVEDNRLTLED